MPMIIPVNIGGASNALRIIALFTVVRCELEPFGRPCRWFAIS
jgi:hypothetical protein